ncbi:MAG: DUF1385 domain-containing protein [Eubacteriales bacterium]|nr:DUF1385 domain-containing protein [Eubacteriales bacterium]
MSNKNPSACGRVDIGGQAVMEGVMMKAPRAIAVSVRRPDHTIVTKLTPYTPLSEKHKWMGYPFLRGIVNMCTMFSMGMSTLQQSTDMLGILDEEPTKFELWLSKKLGKGLDKIIMGVAVVLAIVLSLGLFFLLPELFARLLKVWMPDPSQNWIINLLSGILRILILIGYILFCAKVPDVRRTFEYHGAEHKTVYCNENGLPLTPENAQQFTTLHPRCGTSFLLIVFVISIILFTLVGYQGSSVILRFLSRLLLLPIVAGISYETLKGLAHSESKIAHILRWPGMQMQRLTTRPPTNEMLEVAIVSMNVALHGLPKGCETTSEGYTIIRDYRITDPSYTPPVADEPAAPEEASPVTANDASAQAN